MKPGKSEKWPYVAIVIAALLFAYGIFQSASAQDRSLMIGTLLSAVGALVVYYTQESRKSTEQTRQQLGEKLNQTLDKLAAVHKQVNGNTSRLMDDLDTARAQLAAGGGPGAHRAPDQPEI